MCVRGRTTARAFTCDEDVLEPLALLVEAEWMDRQNKRLGRLLREAKLRIAGACLEDIEYAKERKLDRALMRQLATGRWIEAHHNVVITGATGPATYCCTSLRG